MILLPGQQGGIDRNAPDARGLVRLYDAWSGIPVERVRGDSLVTNPTFADGQFAANFVRRAPLRNGRAFAFGLDGNAGLSLRPPREIVSPDYTVMAWWRSRATITGNIQCLAARFDDASNNSIMWQLDTSNGTPRMIVRNDGGTVAVSASGASTVVINRWHHLCGVRRGNTCSIYLDGKLDGSATGTLGATSWPATAYSLAGAYRAMTGGEQWSGELTGWIDQIRNYNRALSPEEVAYIVRNSEAIYQQAPILLWDTAGGGAQNIAIGQAAEADAAQPIATGHRLPVAPTAETDLALALSAAQARTVGQAPETNLAQALSIAQLLTIGQAPEANGAQAIAATHRVTIGQASDTSIAQALAALHRLTVGQAPEVAQAQSIAYVAPGVIAQANEADLAQSLTAAQRLVISQAPESNAAQPVSAVAGTAIGLALEIDTAQAFAANVAAVIAQAVETNSALQLTQPAAGTYTANSRLSIGARILQQAAARIGRSSGVIAAGGIGSNQM